jgi:methylenetetrahydrofolate dehydrogenase (NADP+)/methenyltetrahydrofolate cyclohydrolase
MELIDGNRIAADIVAELRRQVAAIPGRKPCLALVRVGEDPASVSYVRKKEKTAEEIGIAGRLILPPVTISQAELFAVIDQLNADNGVDGILVQSPLPKQIDELQVFRRLAPEKDVDGLGTMNLGKVAQDDDTGFVSCTPAGIMELLARSGVDLKGKHVVVLGRSLLVGKPVALLALQKKAGANGTVTVCHSGTANLPALTRQADVLIAAIGRPEFVTADMVKPGAVVIDVGINRIADPARKTGFRLVGDVHFPTVSPLASKITPVPGGVGPMTVAMLMKNTVKAHLQRTAASRPDR